MTSTDLPERENAVTRTAPIRSIRLTRQDLLDLYTLLNNISKEAIELQLQAIHREKIIDPEKDKDILEKVRNSYHVYVTITDIAGGRIVGPNESVFAEASFPEKLSQLFYSTSTEYKGISNGVAPINSVDVLLDFSRPFAIDFVNLPSNPTRNISSFEVSGRDITWVNGVFERLNSFFGRKRKNIGWIHGQGVYDLALWFFGIPLVFWGIYRISRLFGIYRWDEFFRIGVYIFLFFILASAFRFLFTYVRWSFPLLEYIGKDGSNAARHRSTITGIVMAILLAAIYDIGKSWIF